MSDRTKEERCVCGAVIDRQKYTICTKCKRNIVPLVPRHWSETMPADTPLTSKPMSPARFGLVLRLQEWSRNCLIDGLKMDNGEPTLQALLSEAAMVLMRSQDETSGQRIEPFVVRHYVSDERPSIKGNGFDGLEIGTEREEAQEFVDWINARMRPKELRPEQLCSGCSSSPCVCEELLKSQSSQEEPSERYVQVNLAEIPGAQLHDHGHGEPCNQRCRVVPEKANAHCNACGQDYEALKGHPCPAYK